MLEVFAYKKYKEHKRAKQQREEKAKEALSKEDEEFIRSTIDTSSKPPKPSNPMGRIKFFGKKKQPQDIATPTADELAAIQADEGTLKFLLEERS